MTVDMDIDELLTHPLLPFFIKVVKQYNMSITKYGPWPNNNDYQSRAVKSECLEWEATNIATSLHHEREIEELTHLGNVAGKRWLSLIKQSEEQNAISS